MRITKIPEHTRQLADGREVTVNGYQRRYEPAPDEAIMRRSPVEQQRRDRLKAQARLRRQAAMQRGGVACRKGWAATKKRSRQSWRWSKVGGKRLRRAAKLAGRRKRATATCVAVGGVAQIGGALMWSTAGLVVTTVAILGATVAGGLFIGKQQEGQTHA